MQLMNYECLKKSISEADLILVGLGEEWVLTEDRMLEDMAEKNKAMYEIYKIAAEDEMYADFVQVLTACYFMNYIPKELENAYKNMYQILENKNYFIVSLTVDPYLYRMGFKEERFVNPCGTFKKLQCAEGCNADLTDSVELLESVMRVIASSNTNHCNVKEILDACMQIVKTYHCEKCGGPVAFNRLDAKKYREEGYLQKWQIYMKWLQSTLNKNIVVLEAGVGMKLPSVIRWPFEKTVFYNQKATMFRVHEKFYQVNEEVAERAYGCKCNSVQMFSEKIWRQINEFK